MQEKFRLIRAGIVKSIKDFVENPFGLPPSFEKLSSNFPHKPGCSQSASLKIERAKEEIIIPDSRSVGEINPGYFTIVTRTYLQCRECGVRKEFKNET